MFIDCHSLVIRDFYYSRKLSDESENDDTKLIFALLTDLHGKHFGKDNKRLIKKLDIINPDYILIAGDMFTAGRESSKEQKVALKLLKDLSSKYTIFYARGNHELKFELREKEFKSSFLEYMDKVKSYGIHFLDNEFFDVNDSIRIYGLSLPFEYYIKGRKIRPGKNKIDELLGESIKEKTNILIAHNPEYFEDYASWGADLTVSGHYHGGLMRLPFVGGVISPRYKLFPKYDYGEYVIGKSKMVLGCGLGTHTLPVRIFNPGEIARIIVKY